MDKWIFFDMGTTLIDETEAYNHRIRDMIYGTDITFEEFDKKRIALAKEGFDGNSAAIEYFGLSKTIWHTEDEIPYPNVHKILDELCVKGYKLGIIANQNTGATERLKNWKLYNYFAVIVTSSEAGCAKPNTKIFTIALNAAKCNPKESIMIGDRLDNDIIPAKALGMKTIWIKNGLSKYQDAKLGEGVADYQFFSLDELLRIL